MTHPAVQSGPTLLLTAVTMVFFAANSVLARLAMREGEIDAGSFTAVRIGSGAVMLALLMAASSRRRFVPEHGSWRSGFALFAYALAFSFAFSFAYSSLDAGTGALILFAAVQITMISVGLRRGARPHVSEWAGLALAFAGLVYLVSPRLRAPSFVGAGLMAASGAAWGGYSLAAKGVHRPTAATAGNFLRAAPMAVAAALLAWLIDEPHASGTGLGLAIISGAVTSGLGYAIWYVALKGLSESRAAIVQLTVPVLTAIAGVLFLGERMSLRLALSTAAILGGVGLALRSGGKAALRLR